MSWRAASGREVCNRCRACLALGASVYVGEITSAHWCEACALEVFGKRQDGADVPVRETGMDSAASALSEGFEALRAKANRGLRIVERDWTGER
jgi:hypothetical protein